MCKLTKIITVLFFIFFLSPKIFTATNYVSKTGGHISPFTNWVNAATNIQAAVDEALAGNVVLVSNGTYYPAIQISVTNDITVKSINGAEKTIVNGNYLHRCFYIDTNDIIEGFTITNGFDNSLGAGVYCSGGGVVNSCIICKNEVNSLSARSGGGVYFDSGGTVNNCIISENYVGSFAYGGGACFYSGGVINNSIIKGNTSVFGGGLAILGNGTINNSIIIENMAGAIGGGVYCNSGKGIVFNSILWNNIGNNLFSSNSINHYNCIEKWTNLVNGIITNNPEFKNMAAGDFRLEEFSPCRNAGTNMSWMWSATDFDGNPRITGGIVDMGAYEYIPEPIKFMFFHFIFWIYWFNKRLQIF